MLRAPLRAWAPSQVWSFLVLGEGGAWSECVGAGVGVCSLGGVGPLSRGGWVLDTLATCCRPQYLGQPQQEKNRLRIKSSQVLAINCALVYCITEDTLIASSSTHLLPGMGLEHGLPPVEEEKPKCKYHSLQ